MAAKSGRLAARENPAIKAKSRAGIFSPRSYRWIIDSDFPSFTEKVT